VLGIAIVRSWFSTAIFSMYICGLVLGTMYSVPPIQLKRFSVLASVTIAIVRGFLLNFGLYYALREALSLPFRWNPAVLFMSTFMTIFASVIAITKVSRIDDSQMNFVITACAGLDRRRGRHNVSY
jgi:homogentisate solanesyltransferase